jgi:hypothetical protein
MSVNEITSTKLTKRFFMELPEGVFLVSNLVKNRMESLFEEKVSALYDREKQWKKITEVGVAQRLCHLFKDRPHYEKWLNNRF